MYPVRILSIDGGGIRGIIPLKVLDYIEKNTGKSIHQLFNIFGGTSTGGIIALGLNTLNPDTKKVYTAEELIRFYTVDADKIFYSWNHGSGFGWFSSQYSPDNIETYLKKKFGETTLLRELPTTEDCDVTVYSYDLLSNQPFYFNNRDKVSASFLVWEAARATSAAPAFFPAFKLKRDGMNPMLLTDGGVYINNPALNLLTKARRQFPHIKKQSQLMVSIGTGQFSRSREDLENAGALNGWVKAIYDIASTGTSAESENQIFELLEYLDPQIFRDEKEYEQRYYRFQNNFNKDVPMDGKTKEQIEHLVQLGDELVRERKSELNKLCATLVTPMDINDSDVE
ncbi:patatin [Nostoc carneum NIES-2107]|nr:patatin [Nostoc carneum NIES-2107]